MISLLQHEEFDPEEEQLRAMFEAKRQDQRNQELLELERQDREVAEAEAAAHAAAEERQNEKSAAAFRRSLENRSPVASQMNYRIAPERSVSSPAHPSKPLATMANNRRPARGASHGATMQRKRPVTPEITIPELEPDYFQPLQATQPSMLEAMQLAPGCCLSEKGKAKSVAATSSQQQMTRKEYLRIGSADPAGSASPTPTSNAGSSMALGSDDLASDCSQFAGMPGTWSRNQSSQYGGCSQAQMMALSAAYRGARDRKPTAGMRDLLHRSLKPSYLEARIRVPESCSASAAKANDLLAGGLKPGAIRRNGAKGTIVANRDLLRNLMASAQ